MEPKCLLSVDTIRGLQEVKEHERVFLSTSVLGAAAAAAALKETWTGLSVSLYSAVLQQGRPFTMKGTGVSLTDANAHIERRPVKLTCFEFLNKYLISVHFRMSLSPSRSAAMRQCLSFTAVLNPPPLPVL